MDVQFSNCTVQRREANLLQWVCSVTHCTGQFPGVNMCNGECGTFLKKSLNAQWTLVKMVNNDLTSIHSFNIKPAEPTFSMFSCMKTSEWPELAVPSCYDFPIYSLCNALCLMQAPVFAWKHSNTWATSGFVSAFLIPASCCCFSWIYPVVACCMPWHSHLPRSYPVIPPPTSPDFPTHLLLL